MLPYHGSADFVIAFVNSTDFFFVPYLGRHTTDREPSPSRPHSGPGKGSPETFRTRRHYGTE